MKPINYIYNCGGKRYDKCGNCKDKYICLVDYEFVDTYAFEDNVKNTGEWEDWYNAVYQTER